MLLWIFFDGMFDNWKSFFNHLFWILWVISWGGIIFLFGSYGIAALLLRFVFLYYGIGWFRIFRLDDTNKKIVDKIFLKIMRYGILCILIIYFTLICLPVCADLLLGSKQIQLNCNEYKVSHDIKYGKNGLNLDRYFIKYSINNESYSLNIKYIDYCKLKKNDKNIKIEYYKYSEVINKIEIQTNN